MCSGMTVQRRGARALVLMAVALGLSLFADLATKEWALDNLSRERTGEKPPVCDSSEPGGIVYQRLPRSSQVLIPGLLNLRYAENCGAAFSMLRTAPAWVRGAVFGTATVAASIMLLLMFVRGTGGPAFAAAVPLIVSGAVGNLSDRVRHGFVVDFLQVDPDLFVYPIFNVADATIFVGVALLLFDGFRKPAQAASPAVAAKAVSPERS
jgi:signal peptidase II